MKTEGTNLLLLQFLPSGAHLGGPWPPRWAPQGREVSHWAVVIDRFHCSWTDAAWLTCRTQPESQQARMTHCHHGAVLGGQIQLPEVLIHNIAMALWGVIVPAIVNVKPKVPINQDQHLRKEMATIHDIAAPMMIMSKTVVSPVKCVSREDVLQTCTKPAKWSIDPSFIEFNKTRLKRCV